MTATVRPGPVYAVPPGPVRRFTVEEYHQLLAAGVLKHGAPFELLEGWIVRKMGKNPPHVWSLARTGELLEGALPTGWRVRRQDPITTAESEPEPDLAVVRGSEDDYKTRHPRPDETTLVVEIADSTLSQDRNWKAVIYAGAGIATYWIVNLVDSQVEVYTDPTGPDSAPCYRQQAVYQADEAVPFVIDGREVARIPARELLP